MVKLSKDQKNKLLEMFKNGIKTDVIISKFNIPLSTYYYITKNLRYNELDNKLENDNEIDDKLLLQNYKILLKRYKIEDELHDNNFNNTKLKEIKEIFIIELLYNKFIEIDDDYIENLLENKNLIYKIDKEIVKLNDKTVIKILIILLEYISENII
uniref:Uncharacterized protein n=1 Tax=viral metagenome TaxID=1070528 RepID=A0A6C0EF54_9ZZZZ